MMTTSFYTASTKKKISRFFLTETPFIEEEAEGKDVSKFPENERNLAMYLYENKKMILLAKKDFPCIIFTQQRQHFQEKFQKTGFGKDKRTEQTCYKNAFYC